MCNKNNGTFWQDGISDYAYITITFAQNDEVYDPRVMISNGMVDCARMTTEEINLARRKLESYQSSFTVSDIRLALDLYREAESFVAARELARESKIGELVDLLNERGALLNLNDFDSSPFIAHRRDVRRCSDDLWLQTPGIEAGLAWKLFLESNACAGKDETAARDACRLDAIGPLLTEIASLYGRSYSTSDSQFWQGNGGKVLQLLHKQAFALAKSQQEKTDRILKENKSCDDIKEDLGESISAYCESCIEAIRKKCGKKIDNDAIGKAKKSAEDTAQANKGDIMEVLVRKSASEWEREGIEKLLEEEWDDAANALKEANRAVPGFHTVYEIARIIKKHKNKKDAKKLVCKEVSENYLWKVPRDLKEQLKACAK